MESILKYPHLFEPIMLAGQLFRNRIFSSPQGYYNVGPECFPNLDCVAFYERKAKGGFASVCAGDCIVDEKTGTHYPFTYRIDDPNCLPGFAAYASAVSRQGAVASVELSHAGLHAEAVAKRGGIVYGPVDMEGMYGPVREMPESEIYRIIQCYGKAAELAKQAGCGMVTIHGGHGWLLAQFWNKKINTRKDKWGGESIENRMRFSLEVVDCIRRYVGPKFPIEYRMSGTESYEDGYDLDEGIEFAKALDGRVDLIHVSAGHHQVQSAMLVTHPTMFMEDGCNAKYAREIKKHVKTPVATVGAFTDPAQMEEVIASGWADVVELGRQTLADPDLPLKARLGKEDEIIKCMRCMACFGNSGEKRHYYCSLNPETEHELENKNVQPPKVLKKVLVAGGGIAGMQAALTAKRQGHEVILCEKSDRLGGILLCEENVPFKKHLSEYLRTQALLCKRAGVDIRLNTEVTPEYALSLKPDVIIAALGAKQLEPSIPGIDGSNVIGAVELYSSPQKAGKKIAIIGGGLVGIELGIYMDSLGHDVTIVEIADKLNMHKFSVHTKALNDMLGRVPIKVKLNTETLEINEKGLKVKDLVEGSEYFIEADTVVYATGMKPFRAEGIALSRCAREFFQIGDCAMPDNIIAATQPAHTIARDLGRM